MSMSAEGEDNMNAKDKIKKIIAILFSIFMGLFLIPVLNLLFPAIMSGILPSNENIRSFVIELIRTIISLGLLFLFHKTRVLKITGKGLATGLICGLPYIIIWGYRMLSGLWDIPVDFLIPTSEIIFVVFEWFLIGIFEECLFRGVVQELFMDIFGSKTRKSVILSIVCTATLFGLCHFQNIFIGATLSGVLLQAANSAAFGLIFGAITFRSGRSVIPAALIHTLIDSASFVNNGTLLGAPAVVPINVISVHSLSLIPILIGIFIFLMRKSVTDPLIQS